MPPCGSIAYQLWSLSDIADRNHCDGQRHAGHRIIIDHTHQWHWRVIIIDKRLLQSQILNFQLSSLCMMCPLFFRQPRTVSQIRDTDEQFNIFQPLLSLNPTSTSHYFLCDWHTGWDVTQTPTKIYDAIHTLTVGHSISSPQHTPPDLVAHFWLIPSVPPNKSDWQFNFLHCCIVALRHDPWTLQISCLDCFPVPSTIWSIISKNHST